MQTINWVVWDSTATGVSGWESHWSDTCGDLGFETLAEAWDYYKTHQGRDGYGYDCIIPQWCTKPRSVVARSINTDWVITHD
jgi:hypothetical protein